MSNIVVANSAPAYVLPHPKYSNCYDMDMEKTQFMHFMGICRFFNGTYASLAQDAVASLANQ